MLKGEAGVILIGFEFRELEVKNCHIEQRQQWQKIKYSRDRKLNIFLLIKDEVINLKSNLKQGQIDKKVIFPVI